MEPSRFLKILAYEVSASDLGRHLLVGAAAYVKSMSYTLLLGFIQLAVPGRLQSQKFFTCRVPLKTFNKREPKQTRKCR